MQKLKMRLLPSLLVLLLLATPGLAPGQEPLELRPGDPRIDTGAIEIEPRRVRWANHRIAPDGARRHIAVWSDTETHVEVEGRRLIRFESDTRYWDGRRRFIITHRDPETWAPATVEIRGYNDAGGWAFIGYEGDQATTVWRPTPEDDARWSEETLPEGHFSMGTGPVLLLSLQRELSPDFTIRYPVHHQTEGGIRFVTVEVLGQEPVPGDEERWPDAWKARNSIGWTYWIVEEAPYVRRLEIERTDGLGTDVWVLEEVELLEEASRP